MGRDDVLGKVSREVVTAYKKAFGKGPERVRAAFLDDMLFVVSKGGITTAERSGRRGRSRRRVLLMR